MYNAQFELGFASTDNCTTRSQRRSSRARWWFQRMRQVVDLAASWPQAPAPRPVQMLLPATRRDSMASIKRDSDENQIHQICE